MNSLREYILWVGDLSFETRPFSDVDALVLSQASYFSLNATLTANAHPTLSDVLPAIEAGEAPLQITGDDFGNAGIFKACCSSKRFGGLRIVDYVDRIEPDKDLQFSCVTFEYEDKWSFIAYRGTDNTLTGWKEDALISVERTLSQDLALSYAKEHIKPDGRQYYIGGHSKGGNLALFATCMLPEEQFALLTHAWVLDGPGMCEESMPSERIAACDAKMTRIIPEFDLVGMIYAPAITDTRVVHSSLKFLLQHSLATWQVDCGNLALCEEVDPRSVYLNETLAKWLRNTTPEQRKTCFTELFDGLAEEGFEVVDDISGPEAFEAVLIRLMGTSGTTKKALEQLPKQAAFGHTTIEPPKKWTDRIKAVFRNPYSKAACFILFGLILYLLPMGAMEYVTEAFFVAVAGWSCYTTIRRLQRRKWHLFGSRERVGISVGLVLLCAIMWLKEGALFLITSVLMAIFGIFGAIQCGSRAIRKKDDIPGRVINILEALFTAGCAIAFLVIPEETEMFGDVINMEGLLFTIIAGGLAVDGISRLLIALIRYLVRKSRVNRVAKKAVQNQTRN